MRRSGSTLLITLALLCGGAPPLGAQSGGALADYWHALERASSIPELDGPTAASDSAVARGLYLLRRWELGRDRTDALVARRELERLIERRRDDAWAHFALGVVLARGPDVRERLGEEPSAYVTWKFSLAAQRAPRELKTALALDASLHEAAFALGRLALDVGDRRLAGEAVRELGRGGRERMPAALALRSEILAWLGQYADAARVADSAAVHGLDAAEAAHLRARALFQKRGSETEAVQAYFAGVDRLTERSSVTYFEVVAPLASPGEIAAWRSRDLVARRRWLEQFWEVQAGLAGVSVQERLVEQYRRHATLREPGRVAPMGAGAASGAFDARAYGVPTMRALMALRHGDPDRALKIAYCGSDVLDLPPPLQPTARECMRSPMGRTRLSLMTRAMMFQAEERAVTGATFYPPFEKHLALVWDVLQFRGEGGATEVVAAVALPIESARLLVDGAQLAGVTELTLVDTAAAVVARGREPRRFAAAGLPQSGWLLLSARVQSRQFTPQLYRIGVSDPARKVGRIVGGSMTVRGYPADSLALSDVVLAPLDGEASFARGSERLSLAPGREFTRAEEGALYYELYGVREGEPYRTEIAVEPAPGGVLDRMRALLPGGRREALRLTFEEEAQRVDAVFGVQQRRTLGLGDLAPGTYRLSVTVVDRHGRSATQDRLLYVAEEKR